MLLLEALKIAERRGWTDHAQMLVEQRALQHLAILRTWQASPVAVPQPESGVATPLHDRPDNQAGDRRPLTQRFDLAVAEAASALSVDSRQATVTSVAESIERAKQLLDLHERALRTLPDSLREVIDRDLCVAHRRLVVRGRPQSRDDGPPGTLGDGGDPDALHPHALAGLALSGGGVRSASYSLGTLQALSRLGLLRAVDFISAVSGGSWAAGWLAAWGLRHGGGIGGVEDELSSPVRSDPAPLRWVRRHIAYLAPRPGVASGDSWGLLVAYISNWLPILALASLSLLALMLLPHAISASTTWNGESEAVQDAAVITVGVLVVALMSLLRRLTLFYREPGPRRRDSPAMAQLVCGLTLVATVALAATFPLLLRRFGLDDIATEVPREFQSGLFIRATLPIFGLMLALNAIAVMFAVLLATPLGQALAEWPRRLTGHLMTRSGRLRRHESPLLKEALALLLSAWLAAVFSVLLLPVAAVVLPSPGLRIAYGPLIVLLIFASAELFGVLATDRRDVERAWSARIGGWMLATVAGWALMCSVALGATSLLRPADVLRSLVSAALPLALAVGAAVWFAFRRTRDLRNALGLAATLALVPLVLPLTAAYLARDERGGLLSPATLWSRLVGVTVLLGLIAWACKVNRFSLHWIYKQGLVRTFLGASRLALRNQTVAAPAETAGIDAQFQSRRPAPSTNIDEDDNPSLDALSKVPGRSLPVLLFNAAVNGISQTDQEGRVPRQWPFTFSQYHCGSPAAGIGYAETGDFYKDEGGPGLTLGGAMAVSGAAVSPTSGPWTQPLRAFLLGILNARLGMWIGNPQYLDAVRKPSPPLGGFTVLREMMGLRARFDRWIHLSDGGHFENLGVYELVRRGCLRIIAIDASCDPGRDFTDLANAIRRARIDLDVQIYARGAWQIHPPGEPVIDPSADGGAPSSWMWFDIDYGDQLPRGRLLYVKPSVHDSRTLRPEVLNYWRQSPAFPHESTINQFFSEQQMEVYRSLGESNMVEALQAATGGTEPDLGLERLIFRRSS